MHIIICVDDKGGMLFNHRRQSRDQVILDRIRNFTHEHLLWVNMYSSALFDQEGLQIDPNFLSKAGPGDFCFVEDQALLPYAPQIETIYLFRWNRIYPGDFFLDLSLDNWKLVKREDFPGRCHKQITLEVFTR